MNPFRTSHKTQAIRAHDPYLSEQTCGVCLQNTYDYSPFGVSLDGRTMESDFYRRGFNGMEKDDELKGKGNSYTTEFRQLDSRLGRWLSMDPLAIKRVNFSPFNSSRNNPLVLIDPSGALDDWYEDEDGHVSWINDNAKEIKIMVFSDDYSEKTYVKLKNIGSELTRKTSGMGVSESVLFNLFMDEINWSESNFDYNAGLYICTSQIAEYYHPLQSSKGFVSDRITSNASIFVANETIDSDNFADVMMGDFIIGDGPENFYFGINHSVSNSMVNSEIAFQAIKTFQELNDGWESNGVQKLDWQHFSQSSLNLAWSALGSMNEGYGRPTSVENFIGGAAISITPLGNVNSTFVKSRITIFNVTSVGSGNINNGQSFPRPIGEKSAQPYTNISQLIEFDVLIKLK